MKAEKKEVTVNFFENDIFQFSHGIKIIHQSKF